MVVHIGAYNNMLEYFLFRFFMEFFDFFVWKIQIGSSIYRECVKYVYVASSMVLSS